MEPGEAAEALVRARVTRTWITDASGFPIVAKDGQAVQEAMIAAPGELGKVVGWKCGATNAAAQTSLGLSAPFYGPLFASGVYSGTDIDAAALGARIVAIETEFAFVMKGDLPPRGADSPYSDAEVWAAVDRVAAATEIAATRFSCPLNPALLLADGALGAVIVLGDSVPAMEVDPAQLSEAAAVIKLGGAEVARNTGANVLGNPLTSLTWLANAMNANGRGLTAGDVVMSGAAAAHKELQSGVELVSELCGVKGEGHTLRAVSRLA